MAANTNSAQFLKASSQYAAITTSNLGITGGNITIECWVYPTSSPASGTQYIFAQQESGASTYVANFIRYENNGGTISVNAYRAKSFVANNVATWTNTLTLNTWIHLALVYDGSNVTLYSAPQGGTHTQRAQIASTGNGSTSGNNNASIGAGDGTVQGGSFVASGFSDALIDEVRFWNTARTTGQLDANFEKQLAGNEAGLAAYYQLNGTFNDLTSNAFNMTSSGSPTFSTNVPFSEAGGTAVVPNLTLLGVGQ